MNYKRMKARTKFKLKDKTEISFSLGYNISQCDMNVERKMDENM